MLQAVRRRELTFAYVAPFAVFMALLAVQEPLSGVLGSWEPLWRAVILSLALAVFSRGVIDWQLKAGAMSVLLGVVVAGLWVLPEVLFPGYRQHWLFENGLFGMQSGSLASELRDSPWQLGLRCVRAVVLVPVIEELFWRGWLMRWLIHRDFASVPAGRYDGLAFWMSALLFASEHGSYWDVGLMAGVLYNWWMVRTRSLADCILAHAVTNAALSAYVLAAKQWQYWQ